MKRISKYIAITTLVIFSSCAQKIDSSTEDKFQESLKKIEQSLSDEKKERLKIAIATIMMSEMNFADLLDGSSSPDEMSKSAMSKMNGKTADDIIALSDSLEAAKKEKEKKQALLEIKELESKKASALSAKVELRNFRIIDSRFSISTDIIGMRHPAIMMKIHNGTQRAISRAYFIGTLASPGRQVPWIKESFNYEIAGGVEPGEEKTWHLEPNMFSDWGKVTPDKSAILTVEVVKLEDASGETFLDADFSDDDQQRLELLKANYK